MGLVTLPNPLTDNTTAFGSHVRANDDTIVAQVNGNIDDSNIKVGANINGAKLASATVDTLQLKDDSVTTAKIADANVLTGSIADLAVTKAKLTQNPGDRVTQAQMELESQVQAFSYALNVVTATLDSPGAVGDSLLSYTIHINTAGANYFAVVRGLGVEGLGALDWRLRASDFNVNPGVAIPVATKLLLGCYMTNVTYTAGTFTLAGNVVFTYISKT